MVSDDLGGYMTEQTLYFNREMEDKKVIVVVPIEELKEFLLLEKWIKAKERKIYLLKGGLKRNGKV